MSDRVCGGDESRGAEAARNAPGALETELGSSGLEARHVNRVGRACFAVQCLVRARSAEGGAASRTLYRKSRNFKIPFNLVAKDRARIKELNLLVSEDQGYHWRGVSKTFPDQQWFTFRSSHDGEYWFAVQIVTIDGKVSPALDAIVDPNMKVVVDTFPPTLLLDPDERQGSQAAVRWEVKDENLDLKSLVVEYQVEGVGSWRRVPIKRTNLRLIGGQQWDAGTAEAIKVRASVEDKAGNVAEAMIDLPEGTASPSDLVTQGPSDEGPPGISRFPDRAPPDIDAGPTFTPVNRPPAAVRRPSSKPARASRTAPAVPEVGSTRGGTSDWDRNPAPPDVSRSAPPIVDPPAMDRFPPADSGLRGSSAPLSRDSAPANPPAFAEPPVRDGGGGGTLLVANPRFKLQYAIDDAGPNGPATVELWITQDGGRTWIRRGDDPDRVSPIEVDLGGEGTYGLSLVARSASGLGDQPPAPGDPPQSWVEVDSTPPAMQLQPPQVGTGINSGKVAIAWRASDLHLPPRSVTLSWRLDQPEAPWQTIVDAQESAGQYIWTVPTTVPQRFHLKVEAADSVGHRGSAETTDMGPIMVDRSRPRSRIIGLDPNARSGAGPSARPLR